MEDHHNGIGTTEELETMVSDKGVLFREFRGDGYLVVGEENVFVVKDHESNKESAQNGDDSGFKFSELNIGQIKEIQTEKGYPDHRIEHRTAAEVDNSTRKPCTEVTIWIANHTVVFYVDSPVHKVAAAFVNFRTN